jgi:hypothetical protein
MISLGASIAIISINVSKESLLIAVRDPGFTQGVIVAIEGKEGTKLTMDRCYPMVIKCVCGHKVETSVYVVRLESRKQTIFGKCP